MICPLCQTKDINILQKGVRHNKEIDVYRCLECGLQMTSAIVDVNYYKTYQEELRKDDANDTMMNLDTARRIVTYKDVFRNKDILDVGCGTGQFLFELVSQRISKLCLGIEPNSVLPKYNKITIVSSFEEVSHKFDFITLFHVLEHISDPIPFLNDLESNLTKNGQIIIEIPNVNDALLSIYNSQTYKQFYYTPWHVYYYNEATIRKLISKTNYRIEYVKHIQRYSLSNHLFWLANGTPGGHVQWSFLDSEEASKEYSNNLARLGATDTLEVLLSKEK